MPIKPYSRPSVTKDDINAVIDVLESQYLTSGPLIPKLEEKFCKTFDVSYASACSNGTAALHLASLALGIKKGDSVIVPSVTFLATANAVRMVDAEVIFCDVDPDTGLMTLDLIKEAEKRASGHIKAVYVVHMGGYCADMKKISDYARAKNWHVLEDACHALGGTVQNTKVGACRYSDISTFSMHATKTFTTGEGGIVATNNQEIKKKVDLFRNHGMTRDPNDFLLDIAKNNEGIVNSWHYEMHDLGYNYRLTDIQAAIGISQLNRIEETRSKRNELAEFYHSALTGLSQHVYPVQQVTEGSPMLHLFQVLVDFEELKQDRGEFVRRLMEKGIGTQVHYIPVHKQPYYQNRYGKLELKGAERFFERVIALPFYNSLSLDEAEEVIAQFKDAIK